MEKQGYQDKVDEHIGMRNHHRSGKPHGHYKPEAERKYSPKAEQKMKKVYKEFGEGKLRSGSKKGPVVKNIKQASAIAISEAKRKGYKAGEAWEKSKRKK